MSICLLIRSNDEQLFTSCAPYGKSCVNITGTRQTTQQHVYVAAKFTFREEESEVVQMLSRVVHRDLSGLGISFGRELLHLGSGALELHNIASASPSLEL